MSIARVPTGRQKSRRTRASRRGCGCSKPPKLVHGDEAREKAAKNGKFHYDAPIAGLEVVDRYTLKVHLKFPDLRFLYVLAVSNTGAVAREVVEAYIRQRHRRPPGWHGTVHARAVQAQLARRTGGKPGLPGGHLRDSQERTKLFDRMTELVIAYAPWRLTINSIEDTFAHPWVR